jgi:hypothetical protein
VSAPVAAGDRAFGELARRAEEITPFLAVEVFQRAQELERQGHDVIHLEFGEPDFETPEVIREAAVRALRDGRTRASCPSGRRWPSITSGPTGWRSRRTRCW